MSKQANKPRFSRVIAALVAIALALSSSGCVERRMTIRSNPPGAAVYVDDYQIGTTPTSVSYIYYGTRKIRLVKDGYETLTIYQPIPPPWYQWCGIDFFSENIWPGEIRDERTFEYQLTPATVVPADQLLGRADQLRNSTRVIPSAAAPPIVAPPPQVMPAETLPPPAGPVVLPPTTLPPTNLPPTTLPPGSAPFPGAGSAPIYPNPGQTAAAPAPYIAPGYATPGFSSPGGFGVGGVPGSPPASGAPMPLFPSEAAPSSVPEYAPPPTTAPAAPPPTTAPPPYSVPPGWRPMGQAPTNTERR